VTAAAPREVLVVGATGKTGRAVTRALVARGAAVRALVHRADRSPTAYAVGARSAVVADLDTGRGLDEAMDGAVAVYHLAPNVHPDEVGIATRVVESACAAGVSRFAFHSVLHPGDTSMPHHLRKAEAERAVRARLSAATILRPAAYHQNLVEAARRGRLEVPYSVDAPFTNVDLADIAEVAALVLTDHRHAGATYDLAGPEALSVRELAGIASTTLGRPVDAAMQGIDDWLAGPGAGLPRQARDDLAAMFRAYDRDGLVGDSTALTDLLGRRPHTWAEVLRTASTASAG
jgi:uncharacterized protein YbjT (DUF2867 family)